MANPRGYAAWRDRRLRAGIVVMLVGGVGLAVVGAAGAIRPARVRDLIVYGLVALVIGTVAVLVNREVRWATVLCLIVFAGQAAAIVGTAWELTHTVAAVKADQLRAIGVEPTVAVTVNLVYSTLAFGVFCWFGVLWWQHRASSLPAKG